MMTQQIRQSPLTRDKRLGICVIVTLSLCSFGRLLPGLTLFTPVVAVALFSGMYFRHRAWAFAAPIMMISGSEALRFLLHGGPIFFALHFCVCCCLIPITAMGFRLRGNPSILLLVVMPLLGTLLLFLVASTSDWLWGICASYPSDLSGLVAAHVSALPALHRMLLGGWLYSWLLFWGFRLIAHCFRAPASNVPS